MMETSPSSASADAREKSGWTIAGVACCLLLALYVGGYFAVVESEDVWWLWKPQVAFWSDKEGSSKVPTCDYLPNYHGLPNWFFAPIHEVDRRCLRPDRWSMKTFWATPQFYHPTNPIGSVRFYDDVFPEGKAPVKSISR